MNVIEQHPAGELYPLALDLVFDRLAHGVVIAVVETEPLFPARRELHDDVFRLVVGLRRVGNDVNVNVAQVGPFAVACFLQSARIDAGDVARHRNLLARRELSGVVRRIADFLHGNLLRIGCSRAPVFLDIQRLVFSVPSFSASRTTSVALALMTGRRLLLGSLMLSLRLSNRKRTGQHQR